MGYQCSKETVRNLPGVLLATGLNLLLNFLLIQKWAIWGVVIASIMTYLFLFLFRMVDSRRFFRVKIPYAGAVPLLCCLIAGLIFYGISSLYLQCICVFVLIAAMVVGMPRYIKEQLRQILWAKLQKKL